LQRGVNIYPPQDLLYKKETSNVEDASSFVLLKKEKKGGVKRRIEEERPMNVTTN